MQTESVIRVLRLQGIEPNEITVWLQATGNSQAFHCPYCGKFQFYHQHRIIALVQDGMTQTLLPPPISPQCGKCGALFHVSIL